MVLTWCIVFHGLPTPMLTYHLSGTPTLKRLKVLRFRLCRADASKGSLSWFWISRVMFTSALIRPEVGHDSATRPASRPVRVGRERCFRGISAQPVRAESPCRYPYRRPCLELSNLD